MKAEAMKNQDGSDIKRRANEWVEREPILEIQHLGKAFGDHQVLLDIDFKTYPRDVICIIGASGSGKSTLLRCINMLETPSSGLVLHKGKSVPATGVHTADYRSKVGMVFQQFNLFSNLTVLDNCMLGLRKVLKLSREEAKARSIQYLMKVGMAPYINAKPHQLSGGQQQRVAIARALVGEPELILADEPTGNLDRKTGEEIINLLLEINKEGKTIVIVTHDIEIAKKCNRILEIVDGKLA